MTNNKHILVTGGAGYIGSHTCKMLAGQGYVPVTFDNLSNGHEHAVKWGPLVRGDICDISSIRDAFEQYDFTAVIHFASFIEVGESVQNPQKYYDNNVTGSLNLFQVMVEKGVKSIVFSSSCAVYGEPDSIPISETTPHNPISPYGKSKMMIENILEDFSAAYDLRYASCRYFNACGADPDLEIGEEHDPETHIIPLALQAAAGERDSFSIFGTDYPTDDGTCVRDYIHVQDLADAHIKALQYLEGGGQSDAFNLGTGQGYSVRGILDAIQNVTEREMSIHTKERRPGDPPVLVAAPGKVQEILKFHPAVSDLDTIIKTAWGFYLKTKQSS